jgi:predicted permease
VAHFYLSSNGYSLEKEKQFNRNLRLRLEAEPGIEQVTYADSVPLSFFGHSGERIQPAGSPHDETGVISLSRTVTAPGYFDLMRIPLLAGRDFTERDDEKAPAVIIVNQSFARRYFPGEDPLGHQIRVTGRTSTVIGLVKDTKYRNPGEPPTPYFYAPFRQIFFSGYSSFVYIRTSGDMAGVQKTLRRVAGSLDPNSGLYEALPLSEYMQAGLFAERIAAALMSVLGVLSVLLAAVGLYSVIAYLVNERTHEIGIRMALGAGRGKVLSMVLAKGLMMTVAGITTGVALVFILTRAMARALDSPVDTAQPGVFAAACVCLFMIAFLATYLPARRATRVDPMVALRTE